MESLCPTPHINQMKADIFKVIGTPVQPVYMVYVCACIEIAIPPHNKHVCVSVEIDYI